jgi:abhydrolase domain-containing protein 12
MRDAAAALTWEEVEREKEKRKLSFGAGGWEVEWSGGGGVVREQIGKHVLHDRIMSYPVVSLAVARVFHGTDSVGTQISKVEMVSSD